MKRLAIIAIALTLGVAGTAGAADTWKVDPAHSEVSFGSRDRISSVTGRFDTFSGTVTTDFDDLAKSGVSFTIEAASINTNNADRDKHLRSPDFFDVEKHSEITFTSSKITKSGHNSFDVTGTFTMHGGSKEVTLPVKFLGAAQDPWGNTKAGFELRTTLSREDYGIVWNKTLETGGLLLGDDVEVMINLQVAKQ